MTTNANTDRAERTATPPAPASPAAQHPAVQWLAGDFLPSIGGNLNEAERRLGISEKTLRGLLRGNYEGNASRQLAKLDEQRQRISAQDSLAFASRSPYIRTEIMQRVWNVCDYAKVAHMLNMVVGVSQIGKTTAARAYKARYPETTVLVELLPKPTMFGMLRQIAAALRLPGSACRSMGAAQQAVAAALSPRHLVIVDEANLALDRQQGADALDVVRRLYDLSGCAVVLLLTDLDGSRFTSSRFAGQLDQLKRRGRAELLPEIPSAGDVALIWQAFRLPEPDADTARTVNALARKNCFGTLMAILRLAVAEARSAGNDGLDWQHFNAALRRLGRGSL